MQEYKKHPELWDKCHSLYRVYTAKYQAWSELAQSFNCDIADLRKKLNSLFASHRREKAKIRSGGKSTWFLYSHMKFFPNHIDNDNDIESNVVIIAYTLVDSVFHFTEQICTFRRYLNI